MASVWERVADLEARMDAVESVLVDDVDGEEEEGVSSAFLNAICEAAECHFGEGAKIALFMADVIAILEDIAGE